MKPPASLDRSAVGRIDDHPHEPRLGYRPALDGVRAVAIVLVLLAHTGALLLPAGTKWFRAGFLGVDLFFVLSGFLITTLLLERRARESQPIRRFYLRRVLRLLPAVVVLLITNLVYAAVYAGGVGSALRAGGFALIYAINWAELSGVHLSGTLTHLWSLAIEEQFYLVWPWALFGSLRLWGSRRKLAVLAITIAGLAFAWRAHLYLSGDPWLRIYIRTDARADSLAIGAALAILRRPSSTGSLSAPAWSMLGSAALTAIVAAAAVLQPSDGFFYEGGFTLAALAAAILIASALTPGPLADIVLSRSPLVLLGRLSYSLYLWHFGIFEVVSAHTAGWSTPGRVAFAWLLTFGAAATSYTFVELPALRLKRGVGPRGDNQVSVPPPPPSGP